MIILFRNIVEKLTEFLIKFIKILKKSTEFLDQINKNLINILYNLKIFYRKFSIILRKINNFNLNFQKIVSYRRGPFIGAKGHVPPSPRLGRAQRDEHRRWGACQYLFTCCLKFLKT